MARVRLLLWKHDRDKDGRFPVAIRITKNRKTRYVFTGEYVFENQWDDSEKEVIGIKPKRELYRVNALIRAKLREVQEVSDKSELSEQSLSSKQIKQVVRRSGSNVSFFQLAAERIRNKAKEGTYSVAKSEVSILINIKEFLTHNPSLPIQKVKLDIAKRRKDRISKARAGVHSTEDDISIFTKDISLSFDDIDMGFVTRFKSFCASYLDQKTRTVTNQLIFIRTVYNQAMKEKITEGSNYPFGGELEKIKIGSSNKIGLTREEVQAIEGLELDHCSSVWHTRNVWLFAYYFAGVRISDVLEIKWMDFMDGRLYYQMNKNEKPVSLKIPDQAQTILNEYAKDKLSNTDYVFPFLKKANQSDPQGLFTKSRNATKLFNKYLKVIAEKCGIEKSLSNHIARHTFGNIAGDRINPLMLQKLYRHSNLKTTINYQANFIHKDADEALENVLNS